MLAIGCTLLKDKGSQGSCPDFGRMWRAIKGKYLSENFFLPLLSPNRRPRHRHHDDRPDISVAAVGARSVRCRFPEGHKTLTIS